MFPPSMSVRQVSGGSRVGGPNSWMKKLPLLTLLDQSNHHFPLEKSPLMVNTPICGCSDHLKSQSIINWRLCHGSWNWPTFKLSANWSAVETALSLSPCACGWQCRWFCNWSRYNQPQEPISWRYLPYKVYVRATSGDIPPISMAL